MAFEDTVRGLREFDVNDLDFDNIGAWLALDTPFGILICRRFLAQRLVRTKRVIQATRSFPSTSFSFFSSSGHA